MVSWDGRTRPGPGASWAAASTTPEPASCPSDQQAWIRLITGNRRARSTSTASTFMATSRKPLPKPVTAAPASIPGYEPVSPTSSGPSASTGTAARQALRTPTRSVTFPASCWPAIAASPIVSSATVICSSLSWYAARSAGSAAA
ncbi:MAG: hypothetical protein Q4G45_02125 [Actinomycetia bacterium]|nr:hypothetical protein [Actinomycetes bacterium]